ncbi:COQ9 family protein [Octadecabacter sp. R77987]|uniref:COQ9 family protein n=1 Tax=Octadecabacter sp. R77987 TaxID=3093874 RepID=UPI00366F85BD
MPTPAPDPVKTALLQAIVPHVAFDGWSAQAFDAAVDDSGLDAGAARAACPRGAVDLAVLYHEDGDRAMFARLAQTDLGDMRFRDKVATAIRVRLEVAGDKEIVRRGTSLFALPHLAPLGAGLIWGTADAIWTALGDTSRDINWYTKRATLSAVYGSVVLFWLGDDSFDGLATDEFIDRRIENVMQFEKAKAQARDNPVLRPVLGPLGQLFGNIKAPQRAARDDLPGHWSPND